MRVKQGFQQYRIDPKYGIARSVAFFMISLPLLCATLLKLSIFVSYSGNIAEV